MDYQAIYKDVIEYLYQNSAFQYPYAEYDYLGRNSIDDEGEVWYKMEDCLELSTEALKAYFKRGVRSIEGEIRLNNDTEWDE